MEERMEGTVKWFDDRKRYGFVEGEDGNDYFVHENALGEGTTAVEEGDDVTFEPAETEKGLQAQNVEKA